MNMFFVYADCKPDGTPFYIGKGNADRLNKKSRVNRHHTNICAKYPSWYRGLAFMGSEKEALAKEIELIAKYRAIIVNRTNGGEGVSGLTPWNKGLPMLPHVKEILRNAKLGKKASEETKRKMSEARIGNTYAKGVKHTDETKAKMSLASKSHIRTPEWKQKIAESVKANWAKRKQG
jgi:hypothetical protein